MPVSGRDPLVDLEIKLNTLTSLINSNDEKIHLTLVSIKEDVTEIKERERSYVTREGFAFYEKAFWIIASAVGSMLVGAIFYVITRSGGN